jgi:hypothetical protein
VLRYGEDVRSSQLIPRLGNMLGATWSLALVSRGSLLHRCFEPEYLDVSSWSRKRIAAAWCRTSSSAVFVWTDSDLILKEVSCTRSVARAVDLLLRVSTIKLTGVCMIGILTGVQRYHFSTDREFRCR